MNNEYKPVSLEFRDVTLRFGQHTVLSHFNLAVPAGGHAVLMGASGSGKTSLLRMAAGLLPPTEGTVLLDGHPVGVGRASPYRVAVQFQEPRLLPWLTAAENVNTVLSDSRKTLDQARALLARVGLAGAADLYPGALSGGMAQRVSLCRALAFPSHLLLLDEPFRGLDGETRGQVMDFVRQATEGKTLLLITHEETEAHFFSDAPVKLAQSTGEPT